MVFRRRVLLSTTTVLTLCVLGPPTAEAQDRPSRVSALVEDSAGIPVVVNAIPAPTRWVVSADPELSIGDVRVPDDVLSRVEGATVLSDGRTVLSEDWTQQLRFYDYEGRLLRRTGGYGDEPGTFHRLRLIGSFRADSLLLYDYQQRRFSVFSGGGAFVRSFQMPAELALGSSVIGVLDDGSPVVRRPAAAAREPGFYRRGVLLDVVTPTGGLGASLGELPGVEQASLRLGTAGPMANVNVMVPFGRGIQAFAAGGWIAVGTDDQFSLRLYQPDGSITRVVRSSRPPAPVPTGAFEGFISDVLGSARNEEERVHLEAGLEQIPRHSTLPAFGQIRIDRVGNLWVQDYEPSSRGWAAGPVREGATWQVFDPEGLLVARVETPAGISILEIGDDYILARIVDQGAAERVGIHPIRKSR